MGRRVRLGCSEGRDGEEIGLGCAGLDWAVTLGVKRVLIPCIFFLLVLVEDRLRHSSII
jgi:hypothetical protein